MVRICFLIFSLISFAYANGGGGGGGGMVSSGGMIFQDANNPWFLVNTREVKYCVKTDEATFSQPESAVLPLIEKAINYWKNEFTKSVVRSNVIGVYELGLQNFVLEECGPSTDLKFLFGYKTLEKKAIDFLKDPRRYIGVSVRESYDEVNLRGKGFIFISSDVGEEYSYYRNSDLISKAWQHPKLLLFALVHELGHIFGIPHDGAGVMNEVFLDQMLSQNMHQRFINLPLESYIAPDKVIKTCSLDPRTKTYLGLSHTISCLEVERTAGTFWKLYSLDSDNTRTEVGQLEVKTFVNLDDNKYRNIGTLRLTSKQMVFNASETKSASFMYGPFIQEFSTQAVLKLKNGPIPKKVLVRATADSFHVAGELKGEVFNFFNYSSQMSRILFFNEF